MERDTESVRLNISEEHKAFLWLPPKTASEHAATVFTLFPFENYVCDFQRSYKEHYFGLVKHDHGLHLFQGHENYTLICTARNPIKRIFSAYIYNERRHKNYSVQGFRNFFSAVMNEHDCFWMMGSKNFTRVPDYFIRQEHLYEDYLKIPFVAQSKIATCGALEELCDKRINFTEPHNLDIKECFTDDMIDYLYHEYRWYFDKLNYEPKV